MIELEDVPELVAPVLIAAFEGWNDAADAATDAVEHLEEVFEAVELGKVDPDDYYDFQVNRPTVSVEGETRRITWPTTRVSYARIAESGRDLVIVRGIEPNMRWRGFCDEILDVARRVKVQRIVTLGALLADSPHTRPIPVTGTASDATVAKELHLEQSRYEGPTGIVGVFQEACAAEGFPAVSIWAAVPYYVAQPPCPKATLALLRRVEDVLDIAIPLGELPDDAQAWQRGADELAEGDSEVAEYVRELEQVKDTEDLPEASGDAIAREFERYLRRRGQGNPGTPP